MDSRSCISFISFCAFIFTSSLGMAASPELPASRDTQIEKQSKIQIAKNVIVVSGHIGAGYLTGKSQEYVYVDETDHKLSQLTWDFNNVYMLNAGGSIQPLPWLKFNADIWFKINDGNGDMDDYDWFIEGWDWTHWSHHDDIELSKGTMFDISVEFPFYTVGETTFSALIGYKHDNWEWKARGGSYVYSTYALHDSVGVFPDEELGITYEQTFDVPYIGLAFNAALQNINLMGRIIGSTFVKAEDKDQHHMRNLLFEDDFDNGNMISFDLGGSYNFTDHWSLLAMFHHQKYYKIDGTTKITDLPTGESWFYPGDVAGIEHRSNIVSLSLQYIF